MTMKISLMVLSVITVFWSSFSMAYRNCNMECPISFAPSDPDNPLKGYQDRQNCLNQCQQDNSQQSELEKQSQEMEEQTKLLKEQREEQEDLASENEELREQLDSQQSEIDSLEDEQMMDEE